MNKDKVNKIIFLILVVITLLVLIYTHSKTFLANDDLPYMFLYRSEVRVNSILDAIKNQWADYFNINGRIFVHIVLQIVLIFDKSLWTLLNPLMIIASIVLLMKLVEVDLNKINKIYSFLLAMSLYLSIINYKKIIYWVAGSVNYVWVCVFLLIVLYLFYKNGFSKKKFVNLAIIFILCMIHECTMVFTIVFVLGNMIIDWYKFKKFDKKYLFYVLGFLGSLVLLLSPANQHRLVSDEVWNQLNLIEKLMRSIPVISKNILNLMNYKYILSYFYVLVILLLLKGNNDKVSKVNILLIIVNMLLIYLIGSNWLYVSLVILLVMGENYSYLKEKKYYKIILCLSIYAVIYFNIISPTYAAGRPNYYFYMYIIYLSIKQFNRYNFNNYKKYFLLVIPISTIILLYNEVEIYREIGSYHQKRLVQIDEFINQDESNILYLEKIPNKYSNYHMDINNPDNDWFTYNYFTYYYSISNGTEIVYK